MKPGVKVDRLSFFSDGTLKLEHSEVSLVSDGPCAACPVYIMRTAWIFSYLEGRACKQVATCLALFIWLAVAVMTINDATYKCLGPSCNFDNAQVIPKY